ncbi:hypothetical protein GCM10023322_39810 [Rugosimonospora acidiphila]|uniref:Uncharacterized protein n=1 Tax=Rugosimonospora acidiphila TaxID=556531 RepID=A0ABP9RYG2_9ACTN
MSDSGADNFGYQGNDYQHGFSGDTGTYTQTQLPAKYKPTPKPDSNFKYPYDYDEQKLSDSMRDIENIRATIKAQQPGSISALADYWVKIVQLLDTVQKAVTSNANALHSGNDHGFAGWSSPAATEFLRWGPGATLYSLKQWTDAANANVRGLRALVDAVLQAHADIDLAWEGYVEESKSDKAGLLQEWTYDPTAIPEAQRKQLPGPVADKISQIYEHQTAIWRKWSVKAQGIAYELSQKYYAQLEGDIGDGRGTRFEGPSNAVIDNPMGRTVPPPGRPPGGPPRAAPPPAPPPGGAGAAPPPPPPGASAAPPPPPPNASAPPPPPDNPLNQLTKLAADPPPPPAPEPPPAADTPAPLPDAPPGSSPLLSPNTALLLGLTPPPGPGLTGNAPPGAGSGPGLFDRSTSGVNAPPGSNGLRGTLTRSGVLGKQQGMPRPPAAEGAHESAPPGGQGRAQVSRPRSSAPPQGEEPEGSPGRRGTARPGQGPGDAKRPGAPAFGDEDLFKRGTAASASVLGGRRTNGVPNGFQDEPPPRTGPTRPGTSPSVLKAAKPGRGTPGAGAPVDEPFGGEPGQPGALRPVLGSPARHRDRAPDERLEEIPRGLRAARHAAGAAPQAGPAELAARHRHAADSAATDTGAHPEEVDDVSRVVSDEEAWAVQTPGGPVLTGRAEQPGYQAEHRPVLGGGG